jgi:hypothetical protein
MEIVPMKIIMGVDAFEWFVPLLYNHLYISPLLNKQLLLGYSFDWIALTDHSILCR